MENQNGEGTTGKNTSEPETNNSHLTVDSTGKANTNSNLIKEIDDIVESSELLNHIQKSQLKEVLLKYPSVFAKNDQDIGLTKIVQHQINIKL